MHVALGLMLSIVLQRRKSAQSVLTAQRGVMSSRMELADGLHVQAEGVFCYLSQPGTPAEKSALSGLTAQRRVESSRIELADGLHVPAEGVFCYLSQAAAMLSTAD